MTMEFEIPLVCLIFIVVLNIVFFSKKRINLVENKYYQTILLSAFVVAVINTLIHFICGVNTFDQVVLKYSSLFGILYRLGFSLFILICGSLLIYTLIINYDYLRRKVKVLNSVLITFSSLFFISSFFLTLNLIKIQFVTRATGSLVDAVYYAVLFFLVVAFLINLINIKKNDKRHCIVYAIVVMAGLLRVVTIYFPEYDIYSFILVLICFIMFFTIENPDAKMTDALNVAKDEAYRANIAKNDFLASMSYKIRTPLNAITGFSQSIMKMENLPKEAEDYAKDIVKSADTLLEILGGVEDVSKIESNKLEIKETLYCPKKEFLDLVKQAKSKIGDKPIELNFKIAEDVPYQLYGDKDNIIKIVSYLLTNAIKYTYKGYILFNVKCINKEDTCYLIISVQDTGIGIKEADIDKLFDKFERFDEEKSATAAVTGLGLAVTKKLVDLMGGKINVKSQDGNGSIFMTQIPQRIATLIKPLNEVEILSTIEINAKREQDDKNISGKRLLIVDDNTLNLKVARIALNGINLVIEEAISGEECIEMVKHNPYDVILMDIMMPRLNGEETLIKLKSDPNFNIPVIALTADAVSGAKERYLALGFTSYISKPFSPDEVKNELIKIFK